MGRTACLVKRSGYASVLCVWTTLGLGCLTAAQAQVNPDTTLGNESSVVVEDSTVRGLPADLIEGGAVRGSNIFHSFTDFNIAELQRVYFANPAGIENILSRVTGNDPSDLLGTLGVDGNANLFFLNPNGIIFGPDSQLDITGSFFASTAESFNFGNGLLYGVTDTSVPPLLAVTLSPGLQYGNNSLQGDIQSAGMLQVGKAETLSLHGSDVLVTGELNAPGGTVQILGNRVGLFESALVDVSSANGGGSVYIGGAFRGDEKSLPSARHTVINPDVIVSANGLQAGDGGEIIVWSDDTTQAYGTFSAQGGEVVGDGGLIEISGKLFLDFQGLANTQASNGNFGTLLLDPTNIRIVGDAEAETIDLTLVSDANFPDLGGDDDTKIAASALENVAANTNIVLEAANDISFDEDVVIDETRPNVSLIANAGNNIVVNRSVEFRGGGDVELNAENDVLMTAPTAYIWTYGGDAVLEADNEIALTNAAQIDTAPNFGLSGNITATAPTIRLSDGAQLRFGTLSNSGGELNVTATEKVILDGIGTGVSGEGSSGFNGNAEGFSLGPAGNITVSSPVIKVQNGGTIGTATLGQGAGGNILIQDTELLEIIGFGVSPSGEFRSGIFAATGAFIPQGTGGSVQIDADQIIVRNGAGINANTLGAGNAGSVTILDAEYLEVSGTSAEDQPSGIFARSSGALGNAGTVQIDADRIIVRDFAEISADGSLSGNAGFLEITSDSILVEDTGILTVSNGRDTSGTLKITTDTLNLSNKGSIELSNFLGPTNTLKLEATELIEIDAGAINAIAISGSQGRELDIQSHQLILSNGGVITTSSLSSGDSGNIKLQVNDFIEVDNSQIFTSVVSGSGRSGDIFIRTGDLRLINSGYISSGTILVRSVPTDALAEAGNIEIIADSVFADNGSLIETISNLSDGGDITFDVEDYILLRQGSGISATAGLLAAGGNGGNVIIDAPFVVGILGEDSDITANAFSGSGGLVTVSAQDIIGLEFQENLTPFSDITASSAIGDDGITEFNRLTNVDVEEGLNDLPVILVDPTSLIDQRCDLLTAGGTNDINSQFTVVGRGGLPTTPGETLNEEILLEDLGPPIENGIAYQETDATQIATSYDSGSTENISEPQGWKRTSDGRLVLYSETSSTHSPTQLDISCASASEQQ